MAYKYITFSIAVTFISFLVGMVVNSVLKKTKFYDHELSNLNFIKSEKLNRWIGVDLVKWIVKNTPFKYLNEKIKLNNKAEKIDLHQLRQEMTSSEIDHLIGFVFVMIFVLLKLMKSEWLFAFTILIVNILMNLHPSLLQQQNKRRIDKIISRTNRAR